jgi:hypothetical protein
MPRLTLTVTGGISIVLLPYQTVLLSTDLQIILFLPSGTGQTVSCIQQPDWHHNKLEFLMRFTRCYGKVIWTGPWNQNLTCYGFQGLSRLTAAVVPICGTDSTFCVKVNYRDVAQYQTPFNQQRLNSFISLAVCLTTDPKPLQKRDHHIMRSRASSFRREYPLLFLRLSSSFLRLLPRLPFTSIPPFIFPSVTCCRRQFLRKMWPI